jgi:hypothetical protein
MHQITNTVEEIKGYILYNVHIKTTKKVNTKVNLYN